MYACMSASVCVCVRVCACVRVLGFGGLLGGPFDLVSLLSIP